LRPAGDVVDSGDDCGRAGQRGAGPIAYPSGPKRHPKGTRPLEPVPPKPLRIVWLEVNSSYAHASIVPTLLATAMPVDIAVSWTVVRGTVGGSSGEWAREIAAAAPDVLAGTLYLFNRSAVLDVIARVHALLPACRIAVGGPECLGDNRDLLARHPISAAFRGEGEGSFGLWLRSLDDPGSWPHIPGLCQLDATGTYWDGGMTPHWAEFARSHLDSSAGLLPVDRPFLQYETTRGCAGRCAFCTSGESGPPRAKPLCTVAAELAGLATRGVREIRLLDRTFNLPVARCVALLRLFREQFPEMRFHLEIHPGLLTPAIREELVQARPGQLHVEAGVQSLSSTVLARVGRTGDPERVLSGLRFLVSCAAFETHADLLAGLPGQGLAGVVADAARLIALGPAQIQLELLKILPGTRLRREAAAQGLVFSPVSPYEVLRTPTISPDQLAQAEKLSRFLDRFYNPPALHAATRALATSDGTLERLLAACDQAGALAEPVSLERRLRLFAGLVEDGQEACEQVQLAWFENGFSPDSAPWPNTPCPGAPPPAARLWKGVPPKDFRRVRIRYLATGQTGFWFVYDRAVEPRRPICVFRAK